MTLLLIVVSVGLLVWATWLFRSPDPLPWPACGVAALTCAVCFTVGGASGQRLAGPDPATIGAALAGVLAVAGAVLALVPRGGDDATRPPSRLPIAVATLGTVVGVVGLLVSRLTG